MQLLNTNNRISSELDHHSIKSIKVILCISLLFLINTLTFGQSSQTKSGVTYANAPISGSITQWNNLSNAISSNDVYTTPNSNLPNSGNHTDYLKITNFQFTIPPSSVITGISVGIERSDANGKSKDYKLQLIIAGIIASTNKSKSSAWGGNDAIETYGGSNDLWGFSLTEADINSINFGFAFSAQRTGGGPQPTLAKVDEVFITVFYYQPLPIELVSFTKEVNNGLPEFSWVTASEVNNDYFSLERSIDGISFYEIQKINSAGNSSITQTYSYTDLFPLNGTSYYRLKQTDFNGNSEKFNTLVLNSNQNQYKPESIKVINTIFNESLSARFELSNNEIINLQLINMKGALAFSETILGEKGVNTFQIDFKNNISGIYILNLIKQNEVIASTKVVYGK